MTAWEAFLLGGLQGLTEFLPVSSSGHLVIGQTVLGISVPGLFFELALHVATLLSVVVVYRARIGGLLAGAVRFEAAAWRYLGLLVVATLPAGAIGVVFGSAVEALFEDAQIVGVALLVTGALLWSTRGRGRTEPQPGPAGGIPSFPGVGAALVMGFAQAFALVPGISRSGATVVAGVWMGIEVREAAAFSFLMAIPAISGAALLKVPELMVVESAIGVGALATGVVVAAVTGVLAIRLFVSMLAHGAFYRFGLYCWVVGAAFLLYLGLR